MCRQRSSQRSPSHRSSRFSSRGKSRRIDHIKSKLQRAKRRASRRRAFSSRCAAIRCRMTADRITAHARPGLITLERLPSLHAAGTELLARLDGGRSQDPEGPRKRRLPGARSILGLGLRRRRAIDPTAASDPGRQSAQGCSESSRMRRSAGELARRLRTSFWKRTCMVPAETPSLRAISESESPSM